VECPIPLDSVQQPEAFEGQVTTPTDSLAFPPYGQVNIKDALGRVVSNNDQAISLLYNDDMHGNYVADVSSFYIAANVGPIDCAITSCRDTAIFQSDIIPNNAGYLTVKGGAGLPYTQRPGGTVSGTNTISGSGTVHLTDAPWNGKRPLTYHWYEDGSTVGTNDSTYSGYMSYVLNGQNNHIFKVFVTDAEGDTGTVLHEVDAIYQGTCVIPPCP